MIQVERVLQTEIMLRFNTLPVVAAPIPNSIWIPTRSEGERELARRIIRRMRDDGLVLPGAPDLVVASATGFLFLELKREASRDLFGHRSAKGALSQAQREFRERCRVAGVPYAVASSWSEARDALVKHGVIP